MKLARRIAILEKKLASETGVGTIKKHNGKFTVDFGMDEFYMLEQGDVSRHAANEGEKWEVSIAHPDDQYAKLVKKKGT